MHNAFLLFEFLLLLLLLLLFLVVVVVVVVVDVVVVVAFARDSEDYCGCFMFAIIAATSNGQNISSSSSFF